MAVRIFSASCGDGGCVRIIFLTRWYMMVSDPFAAVAYDGCTAIAREEKASIAFSTLSSCSLPVTSNQSNHAPR